MRICFVTPEFLVINKSSTGLPNYLYRVSKSLKEKGHEPIIITAGDKNENVYYDGIEVIRRNTYITLKSKPVIEYIINALRMSRILNKELSKLCLIKKIDIIQFCSLYGLAIFYFGHVPSIIRLSSYAKKTFENNKTHSAMAILFMSLIERLGAKRVNAIISPSNIMAKEYGRDVRRRVKVIESPFLKDVNKEDDSIYKEKFLGKKYMLFYGTLYEVKGILVIANIISKVLEKNSDYYFAFIGGVQKYKGKSFLKIIKESAGEYCNRVIHIGSLDHEKLYPIIKHSDFVVLPSLMENLSNACIESMSFGKVVIGTDGTSFEQLIVDGESGFLAIPNNAESLYEKITAAINLEENNKIRMQKNAKKRVEKLQPDKAVSKLLRYYQFIIKKDRRT